MHAIAKAAFELRLGDLEKETLTRESLTGSLLAACSTHKTDPGTLVKIIRLLVQAGADPGETDKNGVTPLHRAVTNTGAPATKAKNTDAAGIVAHLLKNGADPGLKNKMGKRPGDYVKDEGIRKLFAKWKV